MGVSLPCWAAGAEAAQTPLCQRSRAAAAAAALRLWWPWRPCSAEKPQRGTRSLVTSRSHMGHICALQSLPKHKDFMSSEDCKALCSGVDTLRSL